MGLERMACLMQGVDSIFEVDTIKYILDGVSEMSGKKYNAGGGDADVSLRIITDHLRSMVFMIADTITPSNAEDFEFADVDHIGHYRKDSTYKTTDRKSVV